MAPNIVSTNRVNTENMELQKFTSEQEWIDAALQIFEKSQKASHMRKMTVALSGGSTPRPVYEAMSKLDLGGVTFFQVDERFQPFSKLKDTGHSNFQMVQESLNPANIMHVFNTDLPIEASLAKYASELPEQFDLIFLGIGPDGHTASLFPHSPALNTTEPVAHTQTEEFAIKDRVTLTFPKILKAKQIIVLLKSKAEVLEELQSGIKTEKEFPAKTLLQHPRLTLLQLS